MEDLNPPFFMTIQALFFDFDGTLQGFENHTISDSTAQALRLLKQKGYKIFIATGRNLLDLPNELNQFGFDGYINNNGGMCSDENRNPFHVEYISIEDVQALLTYDQENPFAFSFMTENGFSINRINDKVEKSFNYFGMKIPELMNVDEIDLYKIMQMNFFVDEEEEAILMSEVMKNSVSSRWIEYFADINPKGISKMKGIERMAKRFNFDSNQTMAFGDGGNDISMIKGCKIGVAMGNANQSLKDVADYETTSVDDDGIWNALKHFQLI